MQNPSNLNQRKPQNHLYFLHNDKVGYINIMHLTKKTLIRNVYKTHQASINGKM